MTARSLRSIFAVGVAWSALASAACNADRKEECEKFLAAMKPLEQGTPSVEAVDRVQNDVGAIPFHDQTIGVFAKNYRATLTVLASTLKLQSSASAPDGTDDVVKIKVKEARTQRDDAARYCAQ
jgi:hypothetical protein